MGRGGREFRKDHMDSPAKGQQKPKAPLTVSGRKGNGEAGVRDSAEAYRGFCVFQCQVYLSKC